MVLTADPAGPNRIITGQQRGIFVSNTSFIADLLHSNFSENLADAIEQLDGEPRPYRDAGRQNCPPATQNRNENDAALNLKHSPNLLIDDSQPAEPQKV